MNASRRWFGVVALAVASAAMGWWAARYFDVGTAPPVASTRIAVLPPERHDAGGRHAAAGTIDPRMPVSLRVTAVLLDSGSGPGSQAMISVNGAIARPFALGARVHEDLFLRTIAAHRVRIANDSSTVVFDLSVDAPAPTSTVEVARSSPGASSEIREQEDVSPPMTVGTASSETLSTAHAQIEVQTQLAAESAVPAGVSSGEPSVSPSQIDQQQRAEISWRANAPAVPAQPGAANQQQMQPSRP